MTDNELAELMVDHEMTQEDVVAASISALNRLLVDRASFQKMI